MNINDLAAMLRGATITVNIHNGYGDIHSGPEQHNHNHAVAPKLKAIGQALYTYRCKSCGYASHQRKDFFAIGGYGHWSYICNECVEKEHRDRWTVLQHHDESAQIAAPKQAIIDEPRQSYLDEIMQRDAGDYEQMQRDAAALRATELKMMRGWLDKIKTK